MTTRKVGHRQLLVGAGAAVPVRSGIIPALQLVIAMTAGNYGQAELGLPPTRVLREVILDSLRS